MVISNAMQLGDTTSARSLARDWTSLGQAVQARVMEAVTLHFVMTGMSEFDSLVANEGSAGNESFHSHEHSGGVSA